jgi:type IV secretion system protein VirD4
MWGNWQENRRRTFTGGTAGWTRMDWDMLGFFNRDSAWNSIPLGIHRAHGTHGVFWNTVDRQGHALCFAPNGTGKGVSVIIPALMTYAGSMFVIDPKGENAWVTAPRRRELNQRVVILDPWNETNRFGQQQAETTTRFNPLTSLNPRSPDFPDDVAVLAEALIIGDPGERDPFFTNSARDYVAGLIALAKERYDADATLRHVRDWMSDDVAVKAMLALLESLQPNCYAVRKLSRFMTSARENQTVRSTAMTQLSFLDSDILLDAMENDNPVFRMEDFASGATTVYVVLPPDKLVTHARWLRLVLSLAIAALKKTQSQQQTTPTLLMVDEMGTIGPLQPLETGYGLMRGYGIRFFGFFQSLPQLQHYYPNTWRNFIANCAVLQVLGVADMTTAKEISEMLGSVSVQQQRQISQGTITVGPPQYTQRPLMFEQELMAELGRNPSDPGSNTQLIMFLEGMHSTKTLQLPYFSDPRWVGWYRSPPRFARQAPSQHLLAATTARSTRSLWNRLFPF